MAKRFDDDLESMAISRMEAAETVPLGAPTAPAPVAATGKSISVKLGGDLYNRLLAYCFEHQRHTGIKLYHREVIVEGLKMLLEARRK
jgi:hypothetical protein